MDIKLLSAAAADRSVSALDFLPFVVAALEGPDSWWSAHAVEVLCLKVIDGDRGAYENLRAVIENELSDELNRDYLLNIARLGVLFADKSVSERDAECAKAVLWLINRDPTDPFLENPFCYDFGGPPYELVKHQWLQIVKARPEDIRVLGNAGEFLCMQYPDIAKSLFMECQRLDPTNLSWKTRVDEFGRHSS